MRPLAWFALAAFMLPLAAAGQCPSPAITSFPYLETFDSYGAVNGTNVPPPGWSQDVTDGGGTGPNVDWYFRNLPTTSNNTGPPADHTTGVVGAGYFAYVEDSQGGHPAVNLVTPCFDIPGNVGYLKFWIHSNNLAMPPDNPENTLSIDLIRYPAAGAPVITTVMTIGHMTPDWEPVGVNLNGLIADPFQIRFRGESDNVSFQHDIAIDDVQVFDGTNPLQFFDIEVASIDAPVDNTVCGAGLGMESVTVTVTNRGLTPVLPGGTLDFEIDVDGVTTPETVTFPGGLPFCSTEQITFATQVNLAGDGDRLITVAFTGTDGDNTNDTAMRTVTSGIPGVVTAFPWVETFDDFGATQQGVAPPVCWDQETTDASGFDSDWYFRNNATSTLGTGPSADHTTGVPGTGFYAYTEDGGNHSEIELLTPVLKLSSLTTPFLRFWVHSNNVGGVGGVGLNSLSVDIIDVASGTPMLDAMLPIGHLGDQWFVQELDLSPFGANDIRVRFRSRTDGGSFGHDIAIDSISVFEGIQSAGQPGTPGAAVLDINGATNVAGFAPASGRNGPYFSGGTVGGDFSVSIEGEASQAVVFFAGPLNVAASQVPPYGQVDVGGPGLTGLTLVASGLDSGLLNALFFVPSSGPLVFTIGIPPLLAGFNSGFQAIVLNTTSTLALSNAVDFVVN